MAGRSSWLYKIVRDFLRFQIWDLLDCRLALLIHTVGTFSLSYNSRRARDDSRLLIIISIINNCFNQLITTYYWNNKTAIWHDDSSIVQCAKKIIMIVIMCYIKVCSNSSIRVTTWCTYNYNNTNDDTCFLQGFVL